MSRPVGNSPRSWLPCAGIGVALPGCLQEGDHRLVRLHARSLIVSVRQVDAEGSAQRRPDGSATWLT
jgi:surface antigen